jgi:hypothetical protein
MYAQVLAMFAVFVFAFASAFFALFSREDLDVDGVVARYTNWGVALRTFLFTFGGCVPDVCVHGAAR